MTISKIWTPQKLGQEHKNQNLLKGQQQPLSVYQKKKVIVTVKNLRSSFTPPPPFRLSHLAFTMTLDSLFCFYFPIQIQMETKHTILNLKIHYRCFKKHHIFEGFPSNAMPQANYSSCNARNITLDASQRTNIPTEGDEKMQKLSIFYQGNHYQLP